MGHNEEKLIEAVRALRRVDGSLTERDLDLVAMVNREMFRILALPVRPTIVFDRV